MTRDGMMAMIASQPATQTGTLGAALKLALARKAGR